MFTIGAGKTCNFKKLIAYETKHNIHIIFFALFFINKTKSQKKEGPGAYARYMGSAARAE
jgi:hypothetical protein